MQHTFSTDVACKVGVIPAIIFQNILYWIQHNEANGKHFYDGKYWTYNSNKAFQTLFQYLTKKQIENALNTLKENGYIITGNYNQIKFDRTLWYALGEAGIEFDKKEKSISQNCNMDFPCRGNGVPTEGKPIPNNNTDIITNNTPYNPPVGENVTGSVKNTPPPVGETEKKIHHNPPESDITAQTDPTPYKEILHTLKTRINALFHRKDTTLWNGKEISTIRMIAKRPGVLDELADIERLYNSGYIFKRKDIKTFLNNWTTEIDRANNPKTVSHDKNYFASGRNLQREFPDLSEDVEI